MKRVRLLDALLITCLVVAILIFVLTAFPPPFYTEAEVTAELAQIRTELPLARARWSSHHLASYDLDAAGGIPLACLYDVTLQVREGELTNVIGVDTNGQPATRPFRNDSVCSYRTFSFRRCLSRWKRAWCRLIRPRCIYSLNLIPSMAL